MTAARPRPPGNPFATRWVRPGALPYHFANGESAAAIVARLASAGWRGQIVGPHGAGKSTLLAALRPALRQAGRDAIEVQLHDGRRRLPGGYWALSTQARSASEGKPLSIPRLRFGLVLPGENCTLLIIDGYEQLGRWERFRLRRFCRRRGCGLLATAHADVGLPTVAVVRPCLEVAQRLAAELLAEYPPETIAMDDLARAFSRHGGNIRETLFSLYDLYEGRRPTDRVRVG